MRQKPDSFRSHSDRGIDHIIVEMHPTILAQDAANTIASFYLSTWDDPITVNSWNETPDLMDVAWRHAQDAMSGKVLPNTLESIAVTFSISGLSRATTHQLVRSRVGAVFGQQGGRDNNWMDFNLRMPETWCRVGIDDPTLLSDWEEIRQKQNSLYHRALMAGVPYQDARYCLPIGLETALVASYNLLSFKGLVERRLCNRMMWETNYIVRRMADLVLEAFPFVGRNLRSSCEKRGICGSVSPMFPPSCLAVTPGGDIVPAADNPTLTVQMGDRDYDWPLGANGNFLHFHNNDTKRLEGELYQPNHARSLVHHQLTLAERNNQGLWRAYHG